MDILQLQGLNYHMCIQKLVLVGYVSPVGSSEAERTFSVLQCLKIHLRATNFVERLVGMAVRYTEVLNTEEFVKWLIPGPFSVTQYCLMLSRIN